MPYVNCKVMENVLSPDQKAAIATQITDAFVAAVGEPARGVTWVIFDDVRSGDWTMAGQQITTEAVQELLAGAPVEA